MGDPQSLNPSQTSPIPTAPGSDFWTNLVDRSGGVSVQAWVTIQHPLPPGTVWRYVRLVVLGVVPRELPVNVVELQVMGSVLPQSSHVPPPVPLTGKVCAWALF